MAERMATAHAALDIQTGGGEVLGTIGQPPELLRATEAWPPNAALARRRLAPLGGQVVEAAEDAPLPFADNAFDLVTSRHPTVIDFAEIARVLRPGGTYFAQLIGAGTNRELFEYLMGPQVVGDNARVKPDAEAAGLNVSDLRHVSCRVEFFDIGAVIVFLRKVIWTVPDFTVNRYWDRLRDLHEQIVRDGLFVSHSQRLLIDARKRA